MKKTARTALKMFALTVFLVATASLHAFAQIDTPENSEEELEFEAEIDEVFEWLREEGEATVVGVAKYEQRLMDVPAMVSLLNMGSLSGETKTNLPEMFRTVPGVTVYRNHGDSPWYRVSIRGLNDNFMSARTLVAIDGIPFFNPHGGGIDLAWLPIANIENVEIIKGTFSTLYGANAYGGLVNIITRKGREDDSEHGTEAGIQVSGRENIDDTSEKGIAVTGLLSHSGSTYHLSADYLTDDGYRENWQPTPSFLGPQSRLRLLNGDLEQKRGRASWNFGLPAGFSFSGFYTKDKKDILGMDDSLDDRILHSALSFSKDLGSRYDILIRLYHNRFDQIQDAKETFRFPENFPFPGAHTIDQPFYYDLSSYAVGGEVQNRFKYSENLRMVFGADTRYDNSELDVRYRDSQGALMPFGYSGKNVRNWGAYVQADWLWNRLSVVPGVRYDYESRAGGFMSGKLAALYRIDNEHSVYGVAGRGFRAPNFNERFIEIFGKTGTEDLDPEKTWQFELGAKNKFFQGRLHWDVCGFYTLTDDYIDVDEERNYINLEGVTVHGAETELSWHATSYLNVFGSVTFILGEYDDTGEDIERIPKHKWNAGLAYTEGPWSAEFSVRGEAYRMLGDRNSDQIRADSYQVADVSLGRKWKTGLGLFTLTLFAENIFDEHYVEAWPGSVSGEGGRSEGIGGGFRAFLDF